MKDRDQYGPAQMLKEIWEQEDSRYLANTTPKPHNHDNANKAPAHYGDKGPPYDKHRTYAVRHTDVQLPDAEQDEPAPPPSCNINPDDIYDEGYYVAVINMAKEAEKWGCCFNCGKEAHRWADCTEPLKESLKQAKERANRKKQVLNWGGGARAKGVWPPPDRYGYGRPGQRQKLAGPKLTPSEFWNEDPRNLQVTEPLGYVMLRVQIPYVPSYDEDQVALVVLEDTNFLRKCQVVSGTPTINRAVRAMKESEMENAPEAWQSAQHAYNFANYMVQLDPEDYVMTMPTNTGENPTDLDELVLLKNKATIPAFESIILHCCTRCTMMMGYKLHVMTQATNPEDRANLPNRVYVVKTYTELHDGCRNVSVGLRNLTSKPVHCPARRPVVQVVAANVIPNATPSPEFLKKLEEMEPDPNPPKKLTIEERQKLLLELL